MLDAIRRNGQNPYRAEWSTIEVKASSGGKTHVPWLGEVVCGHNPFLVARLARVWSADDGSGGIEWEDDQRPEVSPAA